jgi:hypothetical protein
VEPKCSQGKRQRVPDNAVSTLAQLLGHSVSLVDNKVLVEDLEDLAALEISHGERVLRSCCPLAVLLWCVGWACPAVGMRSGGELRSEKEGQRRLNPETQRAETQGANDGKKANKRRRLASRQNTRHTVKRLVL